MQPDQHTRAPPTAAQGDDMPTSSYVQEIADKFKAWRCQDRLGYLDSLESRAPLSKLAQPGRRFPPNVQPSQLQLKLCGGSNRLSQSLLPTCSPDGLSFTNLAPAEPNAPNAINWQFGLLLLNATHVGPTGFGSAGVQPARRVARCCIFDRQRNRFLGNVHSIPASDTRPHRGLGNVGSLWTWDSLGPQVAPGPAADGTLSDLCNQQQPRLDPVPPGQLIGSNSNSSSCAAAAAVAAAGEALVTAVSSSVSDASTAGLGGANACVVRCAELAADPVVGVVKTDGERLSLYVELNVAFGLVAEDADAVPQEEAKGAGLVDEVTTCWAMISLKRCAELVRDMTISVPLYTGSIYEPVLLSAVWAEQRKHHPVKSIFSSPPTPQLTFRAGPLPTKPPPLVPYRFMPSTFVARRDTAYLLAAAQLALTEQLAAVAAQHAGSNTSSGSSSLLAAAAGIAGGVHAAAAAGFGDAALAALPRLLDDPVLLRELMAKWSARVAGLLQGAEAEEKAMQGDCLVSSGCAGATGCSSIPGPSSSPSGPGQQQLVAALRASVLELAPLLHSTSLPPAHIANFLEHQSHRAAVAGRFARGGVGADGSMVAMEGCSAVSLRLRGVSLGRHPVEVLSRAPGEFVHAPFDVAETRVCVQERLAAVKWSKC